LLLAVKLLAFKVDVLRLVKVTWGELNKATGKINSWLLGFAVAFIKRVAPVRDEYPAGFVFN
jgi:hypothetical protein